MVAVTAKKAPASPSYGLFTIAGVMRRIRVEAALRNGTADRGGLVSYSTDPFSLPNWASSESQLTIKPQYELPELLRASDVDFVANAYRAILRRPADAMGLESFVNQLRTGMFDKIDVLSELRWSEEGRARGVHVNGLLAPHLLRKWGRRPIIGALLRWSHALLTVHRQEDQQRQSENILARDIQDLGRHVGRLGDQYGEALEKHEDTLAIIHEQLQQLRESEGAAAAESKRRVRQLESELLALRQRLTAQMERMDKYLTRLEEEDEATARRETRARALDGMYAQFEDEFRGPRELIRARLARYVALLQEAGKGSDDQPVLDLGAGRGEWLQLLAEAGLVARGVDTNKEFVAICRQESLDVEECDAISALESLPTDSLGAITTMHLVEHLPFEDMVALIDGSFRALKPGGMLIIETPNPENLRVATLNFYLDPTHRNPLPPVMMRWLVENRGFQNVEICRLSEHRPWPVLPKLPSTSEAASSLNPLLEWAEVAPDYAIIARKPND